MNETEKPVSGLLSDWGEALVKLQIVMPERPELDGGIMCPACRMIHGRCHEAVYPLMCLAARTGEERYLTSAKKLFRWGENMLCADGSLRNDAKSDWRGVTVFGAVALHDALFYHGDLLTETERTGWKKRLERMGAWLSENLRPGRLQAYLNYYAANACAMALLGRYFDRTDYTDLARELAEFCLDRTTDNLLIYGEGHPVDLKTRKGCRAADVGGYNVEETLPSLTRCAFELDDPEMISSCREIWSAHLEWMLPDGAWDDSVGSRAFKWTYWGSRTSDGCQDALFLLGKDEPVFAEAALRNTELLVRCTHDGLLYGGPDYHRHGEKPCVHHTFCHAKALAGSLNNGTYDFERTSLPVTDAKCVRRYEDLDVLRVNFGGWISDVISCDHVAFPGAHASGGTISLLWHGKTGPLIACGAPDFRLREPFNQQLPSREDDHRCPCPRLEATAGGVRLTQYYDLGALQSRKIGGDNIDVIADASLCDETGNCPDDKFAFSLTYTFERDLLRINYCVNAEVKDEVRFVLPVINGGAGVTAERGTMFHEPADFFNLNPGFMGTEYVFAPDEDGMTEIVITV
ncbi:MAG: hypothetical protein K6G90_04845 [Clostridia bacterium]|nr:hypothetical protein [Clostridia bacterium]